MPATKTRKGQQHKARTPSIPVGRLAPEDHAEPVEMEARKRPGRRPRLSAERIVEMLRGIETMALEGRKPSEIAAHYGLDMPGLEAFLTGNGYSLRPVRWELGLELAVPFLPRSFVEEVREGTGSEEPPVFDESRFEAAVAA